MQTELESLKSRLSTTISTLDDDRRSLRLENEDLHRQHRQRLEQFQQEAKLKDDRQRLSHADEMDELRRQTERQLAEERAQRAQEVQALTSQAALDVQRVQIELEAKDRECRNVKRDLEQTKSDLVQEKHLSQSLREHLAEAASNGLRLEASLRSSNSRADELEAEVQDHIQQLARLAQQLDHARQGIADAKEKLRNEESVRRKLHNQVQELKGNIRVFCRVRPSLSTEPQEESAKIAFPDTNSDCREIEIQGPEEKNSLGNVSVKKSAFSFDRVFSPDSKNDAVFEEISQLVQSALDGYNVCIFCYGQTGSGKTFTMSADDGMIPRTVHQIYETTQNLKEKGWNYSMEGSFVEVYNENLNDLLGRPEDVDRKKLEIRHDPQRCKTHVSDLTVETLDSPTKVESILRRASGNRSVAATKANERSSRSHSVFILRLTGDNATTGERSEGTLNLVDLAGSERLSQSGSTGDRLKETQNINRSLSCLGDVIGALGQGKEGGHVPYRNSKVSPTPISNLPSEDGEIIQY